MTNTFDDPDFSLILALQSGSHIAFDELRRRHNDELRRTIARFRLLKCEPDRDEILQVVWISVWSKCGQFHFKSRFITWLKSIAFNEARDFLRVRKRHCHECLIDSSLLLSQRPDVYDRMDEGERSARLAELRRLIESVLALLPPHQRETLKLFYFDGLDAHAIARKLSTPHGTILSRLFYGREQMREIIEKRSDAALFKSA